MKKAKKKKITKPKIEKVGRLTSESLLKHTGKGWDEWIEILDAHGARYWSFKEITSFVKKKKVNSYWQMLLAYGYEVHTGKRIDGQNQKGLYSVTTTKTMPKDQKTLWKIMSSNKGLNIWLKPMSEITFAPKNSFEIEGGIFGEIRTMKSPERVRFSWKDEDWEKSTFVQMMVHPRPKGKSMLMFMHDSIKTERIREEMRERWKQATLKILEFINSSEAEIVPKPRSPRKQR